MVLLTACLVLTVAIDTLAGRNAPEPPPRAPVVAAAAPAPEPVADPASEPQAEPVAEPSPSNPHQEAIVAAVGARPACVVVRRDGRTLVSHNPDVPLTTASTQKNLVGAAALQLLGREHRFETKVMGNPPVGGVVEHLWLVGGGDPMLAGPEYAAYLPRNRRWSSHPPTPMSALVDGLVASGVRHVAGHVHADDSRYEPMNYLPGWKRAHLERGTVSPISSLTVNGGFAKWTPPRASFLQPGVDTAQELIRLLQERGVTVGGIAAGGRATPDLVQLAEVASAPLHQVVGGVLKASDNNAAEMLAREIGLRRSGSPTTEAGVAAVPEILREVGVNTEGVALRDGSGLDPHNKATCRALVGTLEARPGGTDVAGLLAVAGHSGTIWSRYSGEFAGAFVAKTGWIGGTVGLTGRLTDHRTNFAILLNDTWSLAEGQAVERQVMEVIRSLPAD